MMNALAGWLRQIVSVVLLASLVDLLLPNKSMQRYVRLVAGLFVLLTVVSPMLQWIKGDFGTKLASGLQSVERQPDAAAGQLAQIEADAGRLRQSQQNEASQLATVQLEAQIRAAVEQEEGRRVEKVDVAAQPESDGTLKVTGVDVVMAADTGGAAKASANDGPIADVEPVAPVSIDVTIEPSPANSNAGEAVSASPLEEADAASQSRIASLIENRFGVAADLIKVERLRGPS